MFFAISGLFANAQTKIQGYVLDKQTRKPLSYSIVSELHQKYGSYSDTTGLFTLFFISENDSLKVSNLGYNTVNLSVRDIKKNNEVLLEASPLQLGEVVINQVRKKYIEFEAGYFTRNTNIVVATVYPLNIRVVFIPFPEEGDIFLIRSIKFIYEAEGGDSPLRVRLLEAKPNGEPGNDLVTENLIISKYKRGKKQIADIDISGKNIYMPQCGVFVALEWIMDKSLENTNVKVGIPGPYIGAVKSDISCSEWINSYNSTKWMKIQTQSRLSVGLTVTGNR